MLSMPGSVWLWLAPLGAAFVAVYGEGMQSGVGWKAGDWAPCVEPCGLQERSVSCWDYDQGTAFNSSSSCPTNMPRPDTTRECPECKCTDSMTVPQCSCNGYVANGTNTCQCNPSFVGPACEWIRCPSAWTSEQCDCCPSGVVGQSGDCCELRDGIPASVDKEGKCCYGKVDGCGVCGGKGVMHDSFGNCCQEGEKVDGMGKCCLIGDIDACGVCEGLSNTCGTTIRMLVVVDPSADGDTKSTVKVFISNTLHYPMGLITVGEVEAMDVTEVLPFSGTLDGDSDADALNDESKDFIFGRVTVELSKLGSESGVAHALVDLSSISAALNGGRHVDYAGIMRFFPVSVMRACGDGICSPGEAPLDQHASGPSIYGSVIYSANETPGNMTSGTGWNGSSLYQPGWSYHPHGMNNTNSTTGMNNGTFNGTFELSDPMQPPSCKADCQTTVCPMLAPPGLPGAMPMECSGRGSCDRDTETCTCYVGFDGKDCATCAKNYVPTYGGLCVQKPSMCGAPGNVTIPTNTTPPPPPDTSPPGSDPRFEFAKKFSEWTNCTEMCGGGQQTRTWMCVDADGEEVGPENCDPPSQDALSQECNLWPCESFAFVKSEWRPCSQTCGGGYTTRRFTCFSSYGYTVAETNCQCTDEDCATFAACNDNACEGPYLTYQGYSACSATCGGGVKSRTTSCNYPNGTLAAASVCEDTGLRDEMQEVACNTIACQADSFVWKTGTWSPCTPATCGGTRTREVTCRNLFTDILSSTDTACAGNKPDTEQSCEPCGFCEDPLLNEGCSGNGDCTNNACVCVGDWGGAICDVDTTLCPATGRLDPDGNCCPSGVISSSGSCCAADSLTGVSPILDGVGDCCPDGFIDACGECGQYNIGTDVFGVCCPAGGVFDTQARCCASGSVDACGVCDGTGDSCMTNVLVDTTTTARRRQLLQTPTSAATLRSFFSTILNYPESLVEAEGQLGSTAGITQANITLNATSGVETSGDVISGVEEISAAMELSRGDPTAAVQIQSSPVIRKIPECGDELCSPGEAGTKDQDPPPYYCEEDCPIMLGTCPSPGSSQLGNTTLECGGLGSCARASLTCVCFAGFDGESCGYCAEGYRMVGDNCEVIAALVVPAEGPTPPNEPIGEPDPEIDTGGAATNVGLIAGLTILCVAITGAAAGAGYAYKTGRIGRRNQPQQYGMDAA
eukprot:jgi/Ulvmu1/9382/UM051_0009.1